MGNGTSQSIILGSQKLQTSYPLRNGYQYQRGMPKFAHPQNRVLPKPVAGQRLRTTDNGSILHTAGTIRGQKREINDKEEENVDPEMLGILKRRSEMIEKENDYYQSTNLMNHRMFHSDPDIARRRSPDSYAMDEMNDSYGNRRTSTGGVAARTNKLKYKKKQKAPDPPPTSNSLPRDLDRRYQNRNFEEKSNQRNLPCKCINKNKAPQPPNPSVYPPPPPPLPSSVTTRTKIGGNSASKTPNDQTTKSPTTTRSVECRDPKPSYEKNVHPLEKWRNCRSSGDVCIDEQEQDAAPSRTTIFDSKKVIDNPNKTPSYLPQNPDPFQKEIRAVTKKIAESRLQKKEIETKTKTVDVAPSSNKEQNSSNSPPKFYFADADVFKKDTTSPKTSGNKLSTTPNQSEFHQNASGQELSPKVQQQEQILDDEIVPSLQRFSPGRRQLKPLSRASTPTHLQKTEREWEDLSKAIYNKQDDDSDIDIRLRPVLPRKPLEMPKFSPAEAWQALGSDGQSSNQSTSDDGPDTFQPFKQNFFAMSDVDTRPRHDVPLGLYEKRGLNNPFKHRSLSDSHWTPRQDLLDDSDVSSDGSEDVVVPRMRSNSQDIPTRFSLPSVMFSNMRPIGSEMKTNGNRSSYFNDNAPPKPSKKKNEKAADFDHAMAPNFRRFLNKKEKFLSEEDVVVSDSNWTFGQNGLQKRGKQYSSDLILSDKKKHELMLKGNFSEFLGDILVSKSNNIRSQMKSSDSGNSNFSFYSTEGQIMFVPEKGEFVRTDKYSPPTKGRVHDIRRKFDPKFQASKPNYWPKGGKRKSTPNDVDLGRKRDLELAKMLEDEVRKRRNKEKISIRQQLQKMKSMNSDEDDDFDDEAYFTEPKSREESQSPFPQAGPSHFARPELGFKPFRFSRANQAAAADSSRLSHWKSSPALLEDSVAKNAVCPTAKKGHHSSSSVMSSPDPETWGQHPSGIVDSWLQKQRNLEKRRNQPLGTSQPILEQPSDESANNRLASMKPADNAEDGDVSSSPTPVPSQKKEKRKTNIYKQLMDIVRKEEKQLRSAQTGNSRESSYSQCESSASMSSESSSSSSSYSDSDSSGSKNHAKNGVSANKEFHSSGYTNSSKNAASSFQVAFVQPYNPSKSYRPVPFEVNSPAINGYRISGWENKGPQLSTAL